MRKLFFLTGGTMKNFKTFELAVQFYHLTQPLKLNRNLKEQLNRAAASIALNLGEGRGKPTVRDQKRFFSIAFGSTKECQAILVLARLQNTPAWNTLDCLAAHLYRLIQSCSG
jgi:four helix bundle protein